MPHATPSPAVIEVESLAKAFDGLRAVEDVSFSVGRGETVALLGANGAGLFLYSFQVARRRGLLLQVGE